MFKDKKTTQKKIMKRTKEDCCSEIYQLLALAVKPLTTSEIALEVNLSHKSTLHHLQFLEFDGRVKHFERGSCWLYWKVIR
jgi:Mn-dependent DtxR family transcriptional regulator